MTRNQLHDQYYSVDDAFKMGAEDRLKGLALHAPFDQGDLRNAYSRGYMREENALRRGY